MMELTDEYWDRGIMKQLEPVMAERFKEYIDSLRTQLAEAERKLEEAEEAAESHKVNFQTAQNNARIASHNEALAIQRATVAEAGEAALREFLFGRVMQNFINLHEVAGFVGDAEIIEEAAKLSDQPSPGAAIVEALEEIADHEKPSDYEWYDSWGDMKGVDVSNSGDVHDHGFSMGTHSSAKIARRALGRE